MLAEEVHSERRTKESNNKIHVNVGRAFDVGDGGTMSLAVVNFVYLRRMIFIEQ